MNRIYSHIHKLSTNPKVTMIAGALFGCLTNIFPLESFVLLITLFVIVFLIAHLEHLKDKERFEITSNEIRNLLQPDDFALKEVYSENRNHLVCGKFIEVIPHPNLNSAIHHDAIGWAANEIKVHYSGGQFNTRELVKLCGEIKQYDPPNGTKYCLIDSSFITEESPQLELYLQKSNYFDVSTAKDYLNQNPVDAASLTSIVFKNNKIPTSLCLHYIILTNDNKIIFMRRHSDLSYHGGLWSASGEEQISDHDIHADNPIENLFKRALCEEIFELRNSKNPQSSFDELNQYVHSLRIISLGIELPLYNPTLVGLAQLSLTCSELKELLINKKINSLPKADGDDEGLLYYMSHDEAMTLIGFSSSNITGLFSEKTQIIKFDQLHPTARYRIFRVLRSLKRSNLQ